MPRTITPAQIERVVRLYTDSGISATAAARRVGIDPHTAITHLRKRGVDVQRRPTPQTAVDKREEIVRLYKNWVPNKEIVEQLGLSSTNVIYSALRATGTPRRAPLASRVGRKCAPGDTRTSSQGYVYEKVPDDWPYLGAVHGQGDGSWVLQHRKMMAESLGRALTHAEQIHHVNGQRNDNRLENLQIRTGNHGSGVTLQCCDCGSLRVQPVPLL